MGATRLEGGVAGVGRGASGGDGRVGRKCGEGASVGAVGRREVDGVGVEVVEVGADRGVDSAVRGGVMGKVGSEKGAVLGYGRRKVVHSVQVHDMFTRGSEVEAILSSLSPIVTIRAVRTMPCIHHSRSRWNYIVHVWCCIRCLDKSLCPAFETCAKSVGAASKRFLRQRKLNSL